jgi:uncharacterized protein
MENGNRVTIFEWDEAKNRLNQDKHGVSFEQARRAFTDPNRQIFADLDHGVDEDRFFVWAGLVTA